MSRNHLLAYFCSDFSETDVTALRGVVAELGAERLWLSGAPAFIDQSSSAGFINPNIEAARTVGIAFELTASNENLQTPLAEPLRFIDAISAFSRTHAIDLGFEWGHEFIGTIENGIVEHTIQQGLLETCAVVSSEVFVPAAELLAA